MNEFWRFSHGVEQNSYDDFVAALIQEKQWIARHDGWGAAGTSSVIKLVARDEHHAYAMEAVRVALKRKVDQARAEHTYHDNIVASFARRVSTVSA